MFSVIIIVACLVMLFKPDCLFKDKNPSPKSIKKVRIAAVLLLLFQAAYFVIYLTHPETNS